MKDKEVPPGFEREIKNIAVDFDGVIHDFSKGWHDGTCYGDPLPGSLEALRSLSKKFNVIIFTAKAKANRPLVNGMTGTQLVSNWLEKHDVLDCVYEIIQVSDLSLSRPRIYRCYSSRGIPSKESRAQHLHSTSRPLHISFF